MNLTSKEIARPGAEPRILVVEDESDLALLLAYNLEAEAITSKASGGATRPSVVWPRMSPTWSSSTGCCRAFPALRSVGD